MLLELENLTTRYGSVTALDGVSVAMDSRALGLLGPNGAGKSTLIRTLLGLARPCGGTARLEGHDIRREGKRIREIIGYMPEHEAHLTGMSVVRYLRYMGELCGLPPRAAMERAHEVLFYVGLGEVRYRTLDGFSYGLQQKVRLAQALIHGPKILILDEPTNGLDPGARDEMLGLLKDMIAHGGSKVIVSSHLLGDIEACCEDVLVMKKGRVVAAGNIEAMKQTQPNLYELRVKGDLDAFIAALSELGCDCRLDRREALQVTTPAGMLSRRIFEVAQRLDVQVRHFYAKRDTLEDVFLKALEDDEAVAAPAGTETPAAPEVAKR
jgi:ABC-2 type transport system ATP-binding protein